MGYSTTQASISMVGDLVGEITSIDHELHKITGHRWLGKVRKIKTVYEQLFGKHCTIEISDAGTAFISRGDLWVGMELR